MHFILFCIACTVQLSDPPPDPKSASQKRTRGSLIWGWLSTFAHVPLSIFCPQVDVRLFERELRIYEQQLRVLQNNPNPNLCSAVLRGIDCHPGINSVNGCQWTSMENYWPVGFHQWPSMEKNYYGCTNKESSLIHLFYIFYEEPPPAATNGRKWSPIMLHTWKYALFRGK